MKIIKCDLCGKEENEKTDEYFIRVDEISGMLNEFFDKDFCCKACMLQWMKENTK